MGDKPLPDDAPDRMIEHDTSIDSLISSPAGPAILKDAQEQATELQQLQIENQLLRNKYGLHDEEDTREALFREQIEDEVIHAQNFATSEEGAAHIRQEILNDWAKGEPQGRSSDEIYAESYQDRKKREYREEQERKKSE
jgi:hypothetical protein